MCPDCVPQLFAIAHMSVEFPEQPRWRDIGPPSIFFMKKEWGWTCVLCEVAPVGKDHINTKRHQKMLRQAGYDKEPSPPRGHNAGMEAFEQKVGRIVEDAEQEFLAVMAPEQEISSEEASSEEVKVEKKMRVKVEKEVEVMAPEIKVEVKKEIAAKAPAKVKKEKAVKAPAKSKLNIAVKPKVQKEAAPAEPKAAPRALIRRLLAEAEAAPAEPKAANTKPNIALLLRLKAEAGAKRRGEHFPEKVKPEVTPQEVKPNILSIILAARKQKQELADSGVDTARDLDEARHIYIYSELAWLLAAVYI